MAKGNLFPNAKKSIYRHMEKAIVASTGEMNLVVEVTYPEKAQTRINEDHHRIK